ncbi:sigma-70 family RNA polymerase sigma factor [Candidatus Uhrbacteria bacterium]|nr:sigma-70 family RNA polymerase sigma factor [Candidatus Uhrbacteria bacterium]
MNQLVDHYLLYRVRAKRDAEAFGRLYDQYVTSIYRFVYLKVPTREIAEDVTSETFLRFWQAVLDSQDILNIRAYLYRIARNLVVDYYRKQESTEPISGSVTFSDENTSTDHEGELSDRSRHVRLIEARADLQIVLDRIGRLKEDYQDVLKLRLIDGLAFGDIAKIIGKSAGNVRVIYHRALKALDALDPTP